MFLVLTRIRKLVAKRYIHACQRLAIILILLSVPCSTDAQSSFAAEYRAKASFLATFPSFIDWPESAFSSADAPFALCVLGDFRFGTALAEFARNASSKGRRINVQWARKDGGLNNCHILFVSASERNRYAKILQIVKRPGVLTVGETADFLSAGGTLSFSFQNGFLQFEVNLVAANEAQLRVSSKLLALARRVVKPVPTVRKDVSRLGWTASFRQPFDPEPSNGSIQIEIERRS